MPYLIADKQGRTVADIVLPKLNNAISYTPDGGQLYLEEVKKDQMGFQRNQNETTKK